MMGEYRNGRPAKLCLRVAPSKHSTACLVQTLSAIFPSGRRTAAGVLGAARGPSSLMGLISCSQVFTPKHPALEVHHIYSPHVLEVDGAPLPAAVEHTYDHQVEVTPRPQRLMPVVDRHAL